MRLMAVVFISSVLSVVGVAFTTPASACSSSARSLWDEVDAAPRIVVGRITDGVLRVSETLKGPAASTIRLRTPARMTKCTRRVRSNTRVLMMLTLDGALTSDFISAQVYVEGPREELLQSIRTYLSSTPTKRCVPEKLPRPR